MGLCPAALPCALPTCLPAWLPRAAAPAPAAPRPAALDGRAGARARGEPTKTAPVQKVRRLTFAALAFVSTLAAASGALAEPQTRTLYNEKGQEVGRATTRGGTTTFNDDRGREVGRAERRGDGTTNFPMS